MIAAENYKNWKSFSAEYSHFKKIWSSEDLNLPWIKTVQIDEVPEDDVWNIYSTQQKIELQEIQKRWGYDKHVTEHYMSLNPPFNEKFITILDKFSKIKHHHNFLKLPAAKMLAWHIDLYSYFIKEIGWDENLNHEIKRTVIFMEDWMFGQVLQIGKEVVWNWKAGDAFTWKGQTWHGAANFGNTDLIVMQVTHE